MEAELRQARHHLRGRLNSLKLCVSALEMLQTRAEVLEFLDMIDQSADRTVLAVDRWQDVLDRWLKQNPQGPLPPSSGRAV